VCTVPRASMAGLRCKGGGGGGQDCSICLDEFHGLLLPPVIMFMDGGLAADGRGL
jgi:hypothetical protein